MKIKKEFEIKIEGQLTISSIEKILEEKYSETTKFAKKDKAHFIFNLEELFWAGFFPSCLLFSWIIILKKLGANLEVNLPDQSRITPQLKKVLIDYGLIDRLKENSIECSPFISSNYPSQGLAFNTISSKDNLFTYLKGKCKNLTRKLNLDKSEKDIVKTTFEIIIFELIENSFNHTDDSKPYFGLSYAISSGTRSSNEGLMAVFDKNTPYIEIAIGDLGPGLNKYLETVIPSDYIPPFSEKHKFLKDEKVVSYAFEFSSTRDLEGRKRRLNKLVGNHGIDPTQIATGLFCVHEIAKNCQGQLIIRTPKTVLSIDYYRNPGHPVIKGKKNTGVKRLARLLGTHYLLRIPLKQRTSAIINYVPTLFTPNTDVQQIQVFDNSKTENDSGENILNALTNIEQHIIQKRSIPGITIILPPPSPLISRALMVFIAALKTMHHGKRLLVWSNYRAFELVKSHEDQQDIVCKHKYIPGSPVLVGDILSNKFVVTGDLNSSSNIFISSTSTKHIEFCNEIIPYIQKKYCNYLKVFLTNLINSDDVKYEYGSFLVEKKYYTSKFYEISKLLFNDNNIRRIAEWCFYQIKSPVDLIVVTSKSLFKVAEEMLSMNSDQKVTTEVILIDSPINPASTSLKILPHINKNTLILTDVICRGENIQQLLSIISPLCLNRIITLVDARGQIHLGAPITYTSGEESESIIDVVSIVEDEITPHDNPHISDQIFVIDKRTKSPTLYIRASEPQINIENVLQDTTFKTASLFIGHHVFDNKHYSYFLHLPRLLKAYKKEIANWFDQQVDFFSKTSKEEDTEWQLYSYNPKGNLTWSEHVLDVLPSNIPNTILTKDKLRAPTPPVEHPSKNLNAIIFLPAIASGETARLCIEWVSRIKPANILVLCFMSRMDPYHRTFFSGINRYREASLYFSFFLDLTIGAYPNASVCPMCQQRTELQRLFRKLLDTENTSDLLFPDLLTAINNKISSQQAITLEYSSTRLSSGPEISEKDASKAYIRALYEGAERDISGARKQLNKFLLTETKYVDYFLEIFSFEKESTMFSLPEIENRLYRTFNIVETRAHELLSTAKPPLHIGKYLGAIISLIPNSFVSKCCELISRYLYSHRDTQEIIIALLSNDISPIISDDLYRLCRTNGYSESEKALLEASMYFEWDAKSRPQNIDDTINVFSTLWSRLARSGNFSDSLRSLKVNLTNKSTDYDDLTIRSSALITDWRASVSKSISILTHTSMWTHMSEKHPEFGHIIADLDYGMSKYDQIFNLMTDTESNKLHQQEFIEKLKSIILQIDESAQHLREKLSSFFINPTKCIANHHNDILPTLTGGGVLRYVKNIDPYVGEVFCNLNELNYVCEQIIENCQKHKKINMRGTCVWFNIFKENNKVCLEFIDDIEGEFQLDSDGGLKIVQDFSNKYGELEIVNLSGSIKKSIKIYLHCVL